MASPSSDFWSMARSNILQGIFQAIGSLLVYALVAIAIVKGIQDELFKQMIKLRSWQLPN